MSGNENVAPVKEMTVRGRRTSSPSVRCRSRLKMKKPFLDRILRLRYQCFSLGKFKM
jgi:hypothetical protein